MQDPERATRAITPDTTRAPGDDPSRPGDDPGRSLAGPRGDATAPDVDGAARDDRETERRDELADRVGSGGPSPAGRDRPDLLPDVEPPELPM
ncbi:MAG: hypothetical protein EPO36_06915 [Chloroflexota bacterium]|nr:MAG: hypothetical protein EPO36_06915 [Chloroflexota bacterium]